MQIMLIGEYIRQRRLDLGITQAELCEGCCAVSTLSRLEAGKQVPGRALVHALLQRLGLPEEQYFALLGESEAAVEALKKDIRADEIRFHKALADQRPQIREEAMEKLARLEALTEEDDRITRQYILSSKVTLGRPEGPYSVQERLDMLMGAIRLTVPRFDLDKIGLFRYSINETTVINQIASAYANAGEREKAAGIYSQLLSYIEAHDRNLPGFANHFCLVAHNYAIDLGLWGHYKEAIALAERGWELCVAYGDYQFLAGFLAILAECSFFLGEKEKSAKLYCQAYCLYDVTRDNRNRETMRQEMRERLGLKPPY
ncbi:MAG: helix-turn-helix domain-containing protein [Oscillibacter sp.]|nr:helix-turn-helix domain-containing protein [Oscillibacter sp.]